MQAWLYSYFQLKKHGSSISNEVRAGLTTFLTMAYILFVNPQILSAAIDVPTGQLMTATALAAAFGSLLMGLWARLPVALAPGMGLNAFFTFVVVNEMGYSWQEALTAVFVSGLIMAAISAVGLRQWIIDALPLSLKMAITAGIGCFLALIGFKNCGFTVDHPVTLVSRGDFATTSVLAALIGLGVGGICLQRGFKGALLLAILATAASSFFWGDATFNLDQGIVAMPVMPSDLFMALDFSNILQVSMLSAIFTFFFVDFFDTAGTLIALTQKAGLMDDKGRIPLGKAAFISDGLASSFGALCGTSSTTSFIESAAGIEEGARTGLAAVTTGLCFVLSLFLWPLVAALPPVSSAPVLILVGSMMMVGAAKVEWHDYREALPAFLTILGMPFTFSISDGIAMGIITYVVLNIGSGSFRKVSPMLAILAVLLVIHFL
jgi:AGZA family xanthine/uracil permease-like MFS transporter